MIGSPSEIKDSGNRLAAYLTKHCVEATGEDWTKHIFALLTDFCRSEFGQHEPAFSITIIRTVGMSFYGTSWHWAIMQASSS
jgi:hypothetical protein